MTVWISETDTPKIEKLKTSFNESTKKLRKRLNNIELGVGVVSYIVLGTVLAEGLRRVGYPLSHMSYAICGMTGMVISLKVTEKLTDMYMDKRERNFKEEIKLMKEKENAFKKNNKTMDNVVEQNQVRKVSLDVKKPKKVIDLSVEEKPKKVQNTREM